MTFPLALALLLGGGATGDAGAQNADLFLGEVKVAMDKMMRAMMRKPSGDTDVDFAAMMVPHHQGAIDMAIAELRYGKNDRLKRIAQEIIVEQQQEIAAMRLSLVKPLPASGTVPASEGAKSHVGH